MDSDDRRLLQTCILGVHDESFSRQNVLFNSSLFPPGSVTVGTCLQISSVAARLPQHDSGRGARVNGSDEARRKNSSKSMATNIANRGLTLKQQSPLKYHMYLKSSSYLKNFSQSILT